MTTNRDLLIGVSLGFAYEDVSGFIRSFRRFNQDAHLVLIMACPNAATQEEFDRQARQNNFELLRPKQIPGGFIQRTNWRYFAYLDHLENHDCYRNVMLSDVRDVFFQDDPFRQPLQNHVVCAVENMLIRQNRMNALWLYKAYGQAVLATMLNHRVSCSGTTIGTYAGIRGYCSLMCEQINTKINVETTDQAYHNFVYWNKNSGFMSLDIEERFFNTVGSKNRSVFEIDQHRVRVDGVESVAVHQYDRHESLSAHVRNTYGLN
jgi:hypothetical protein